MSSRRYVFLMGSILAAVVAALLLAVPGSPIHKKPTLGLDLRGGLEVVLKAVPPKGHALTAADLDRSVTIMRTRIDRIGVSEPDVRKQPPNQQILALVGLVGTMRERFVWRRLVNINGREAALLVHKTSCV